MYGMKESKIGSHKKMNNTKIVYDCQKNSTSFVPLSAAELADIEAAAALAAEQAAKELEAPVVEE